MLSLSHSKPQSVWIDVRVKLAQFISKSCPIVVKAVFTQKVTFYKIAQQITYYFLLILLDKIVTKAFKKSNFVTLAAKKQTKLYFTFSNLLTLSLSLPISPAKHIPSIQRTLTRGCSSRYQCTDDLQFDWFDLTKQVKLFLFTKRKAAKSKQNKQEVSCTLIHPLKLVFSALSFFHSLHKSLSLSLSLAGTPSLVITTDTLSICCFEVPTRLLMYLFNKIPRQF